jgi:hypothetical protein
MPDCRIVRHLHHTFALHPQHFVLRLALPRRAPTPTLRPAHAVQRDKRLARRRGVRAWDVPQERKPRRAGRAQRRVREERRGGREQAPLVRARREQAQRGGGRTLEGALGVLGPRCARAELPEEPECPLREQALV